MTISAPRPRIAILAGAWLLGLNIFAQTTAKGGDTALLGVIAASLNCLCGLVLLLIGRPSFPALRRMAPPILLLGAALAWAIWPDLYGTRQDGQAARIAPDLTAADVARYLGSVCLLVGAAAFSARRGAQRAAMKALALCIGANLLCGLILRQIDPHRVWGIRKGMLADRFTGTMLNANAMATVYAMGAVIALGLALVALRDRNRPFRDYPLAPLAFIAVFMGALGAIGPTGSRTAMASALIASALLAFLHFSKRQRRNVHGIAIGAAIVSIGGMLVIGGLVTMRRLPNLGVDAIQRWELWDHYLAIAGQAGPFGYGLGSFAQVNSAMLPANLTATDLWYVNAAHNVVLQMVIEGGLIFCLLASLAIVMIAVGVVRRWPERGDPATILQRAGASALLIALLGGMVDVALNVPAVVTLAASVLGLLWGRSLRPARRKGGGLQPASSSRRRRSRRTGQDGERTSPAQPMLEAAD
jgi:O-antigen ligase